MATSFDPRVRRIITANARKMGLDPAAVLSVAAGEGGIRYGAVGDSGTSFGPFQLHWNGAMPKKYWGNASASAAFANSPAGIQYALRQMAKSGAAGLSGADAVNTIVRRFERPADPDTSVRNATQRLGQFQSSSSTPARTIGLGMPQPVQMGDMQVDQTAFKQAFASYLMDSAQRRMRGEMPNFGGLMQLAQARKQMIAASQNFGPAPAPEHVHGGRGHTEFSHEGGVLNPGTSWKGTHPTDNLGWGTKSAADFMAAPGTKVAAMESGRIEEHGSAQGGESMTFIGDSGREYWLGHITGMAPVGSRVRAGQIIARISPDHPDPHLHIDVRG